MTPLVAPAAYDRGLWQSLLGRIGTALDGCFARGQDVSLINGERLFLKSANGTVFQVLVTDSGEVTTSAVLATITATENLAAGDLVNVYTLTGAARVRKADATAEGKEANGFVTAAVLSGASATVYFRGTDTGVSALTPGTTYYLDTTAGGVTATPPTGAGNVVQRVGVAQSATALSFHPGEPVVL